MRYASLIIMFTLGCNVILLNPDSVNVDYLNRIIAIEFNDDYEPPAATLFIIYEEEVLVHKSINSYKNKFYKPNNKCRAIINEKAIVIKDLLTIKYNYDERKAPHQWGGYMLIDIQGTKHYIDYAEGKITKELYDVFLDFDNACDGCIPGYFRMTEVLSKYIE